MRRAGQSRMRPSTSRSNACGRAALVRRLLLLLVLVARGALAHDLAIDQLWMTVDDAGSLSGQLLIDPELTGYPQKRSEEEVISFVRSGLELLIDGRPVSASWTLRELYSRGGAASADILHLDAELPSGARTLMVRLGSTVPALVLVVQKGEHSRATLLERGGTSSPYLFGAPENSWQEGGAEIFTPNPPIQPAASLSAAPLGNGLVSEASEDGGGTSAPDGGRLAPPKQKPEGSRGLAKTSADDREETLEPSLSRLFGGRWFVAGALAVAIALAVAGAVGVWRSAGRPK